MIISKDLIRKIYEWLGKDGRSFFTKVMLAKNGLISLHFREGMQVRNFLRGTGLCKDWSAHDLDNNWMEIIKMAIKQDYHDRELLTEKEIETLYKFDQG